MPVSYTNRKGLTYTLYRGQTKTGKPRYYFGRAGKGEPVVELPVGFTISESVNGVVSLVKDHPSLIQPEEVAAVEAEVQKHPEAGRYRVVVKHDRIEIYESVGPDYEALLGDLHMADLSSPGLSERLQAMSDRYARYTPVLRFILLDPTRRRFGVLWRTWHCSLPVYHVPGSLRSGMCRLYPTRFFWGAKRSSRNCEHSFRCTGPVLSHNLKQ